MERNEDRNAQAQLELFDRTVPLELTAEFVLPDYRSEISRLLWVRPTLMPPEHFVGGSKVDFSGPVSYQLLYVGPDNALYSANLEDGYAFSLPLDEIGELDRIEDPVWTAEATPEAMISRVTGPRKLSLRCRAHMRVRGYATRDLSVCTNGAEGREEEICRQSRVVQTGRLIGTGKETVTLCERLDAEENLRVISSTGSVFLPEVNTMHDGVLCRGECVVTLLCCREGETSTPHTVQRRIPLEAEIALDGVSADCRACATGTVSEIAVSIEAGQLSIEPRVTLCARAFATQDTVVCEDILLPGTELSCRSAKQTLWRTTACCNRNFSISGELPLEEIGLRADDELGDAIFDVEVREKTQDGGKCAISGEVKCRLLCRRTGEYSVMPAAFPFRVLCDCGAGELDVTASVPICHVAIIRDTLRMDAELQLAVCGCEHERVCMLSEATFTPAPARTFTGTELYYPTAGETLWSVAKRYSISPEALAKANKLVLDDPAAPDSLGGAKYLLLP